MDNTLGLWLLLVAVGAVTLGYRVSFLIISERLQLPTSVQRALRFVPVAVLTAIILPALVFVEGNLDLSLGNARLIAGTIAALVAWRTRNTLLTIAIGMGALWILQAFLPV